MAVDREVEVSVYGEASHYFLAAPPCSGSRVRMVILPFIFQVACVAFGPVPLGTSTSKSSPKSYSISALRPVSLS